MMSTPFTAPGVMRPAVRPAKSAGLADEAEVIGIVVGGKARAYSVQALSSTNRHVVNDLVGDIPATVTYCNRTRCAGVFTDARRGRPLDVWLGGFYGDQMLIKVGDDFFGQESGKPQRPGAVFPYTRLTHQLTTWKAWRLAHPDTDVYVGD
jgi:hypothetical protein